ncbi:MAG TPA: hypothetical protein VG759_14380 [Candidatus Angelobacter sp.]|jgi:hypothetical protein|nr:hypothetical protein [Candidatus Angelobacter sp.]
MSFITDALGAIKKAADDVGQAVGLGKLGSDIEKTINQGATMVKNAADDVGQAVGLGRVGSDIERTMQQGVQAIEGVASSIFSPDQLKLLIENPLGAKGLASTLDGLHLSPSQAQELLAITPAQLGQIIEGLSNEPVFTKYVEAARTGSAVVVAAQDQQQVENVTKKWVQTGLGIATGVIGLLAIPFFSVLAGIAACCGAAPVAVFFGLHATAMGVIVAGLSLTNLMVGIWA